MMVRLIVLVIAWSITSCGVQLAEAPEGLADPVEDDDRLVDRVAEHGEHRGQHRERELPLEEREEAEDDDDVVQVGDDRGDRELPLEAKRQVDHDADDDEGERLRAVLGELVADLRADELAARQPHRLGRAGGADLACRRLALLGAPSRGDDAAALGLAQLAEDAARPGLPS